MSYLPNGWANAHISDLLKIRNGFAFKSSDFCDEGVPLIRQSELKGDRVDVSGAICLPENFLDDHDSYIIQKGDVLIGMSGSLGKVSLYSSDKYALQNQRTGLLMVESQIADKTFALYALKYVEPQILEQGKGVAVQNVSSSQIESCNILLPPRAEQTRIVAKLEELLSDLDAGVAELKAAQKKLAQYRQSLLKAAVEGALTAQWRAAHSPQETGAQLLERILTERRARWEAKQLAKFKEQGKPAPKDWQKKYPEPVAPDTTSLPQLPQGWVWASVDQMGEVLSGFAFKSTDFCGDGIPVTKIANIGYGVYENGTEQEYLDPVFLKDAADFIISSGDILIALTRPITNGTLKSCLYPDHRPISLLNQRVAALKITSLELKDYFYLLTRTPYFREAVRASTSETLQPNMSPNALKAIPLPLPPICEAQELLSVTTVQLEEVANQELNVSVALHQSTSQRQNLLRAAFAGELVPQDPNDEPASALLERIRAERAAQVGVKKPRGRKAKEQA